MNKLEAYQALISEMKSIANGSTESLVKNLGAPIEIETSTKSGKHYSISILISQKNENAYLLEGNIHDNNSFKYELLEEKLEIEK